MKELMLSKVEELAWKLELVNAEIQPDPPGWQSGPPIWQAKTTQVAFTTSAFVLTQ